MPQSLLDGLKEAAETAGELDATMERLHTEVKTSGELPDALKDELSRHTYAVPDEQLIERLRRLSS